LKKLINERDVWLMQGDALVEMQKIEDKSIDLIAADLPYGVSNNKWDTVIPLEEMWQQFERIAKEKAIIVLTATQPFATSLICSRKELFKYDLIWEKNQASGQLNVNKMPLRAHEHLLVFYKKHGTYNEQRLEGVPYKVTRKATWKSQGYGEQKEHTTVNDGYRNARSVIKMGNQRKKGNHPTQKPVELMEYIIKVYSNEQDTVLDCCMGNGTTGVAAKLLNRKFIGIELDQHWFYQAKKRILET